MISTRLTRMLDISHPVVLAPLGGAGRWREAPEPPLAARVTYAMVALLVLERETSQTRFHLHVRVS